jgi:hypothetical protein
MKNTPTGIGKCAYKPFPLSAHAVSYNFNYKTHTRESD